MSLLGRCGRLKPLQTRQTSALDVVPVQPLLYGLARGKVRGGKAR